MKTLLVKFCLVAEITEGGRERERERKRFSLFCFWILGANAAFFFFFFAWLSFVWFCGKTEMRKSRKFDEDVVG